MPNTSFRNTITKVAMKFITFVALIAFLLIPVQVFAADQASKETTATGYYHTLCAAETAIGACGDVGAATGDLYAITDRYNVMTFYYSETGSGGSCDIYADSKSAAFTSATDLDSSSALKVNVASLSSTLDKITLSDVSFGYVWIECTVAATTMTVVMQGSVGPSRTGR
tara:strand:- start:249 stop:755 length:507 start_codon:yes stop_codon:yes gene_type:complete